MSPRFSFRAFSPRGGRLRRATAVALLFGFVACPVFPALGEPAAVHRSTKAELTLERAIELAFERNPDLAAAAARIGAAEARVDEVVAAFYPKLTARVGYGASNDPAMAFSYIVAQRRFNFGLDINQPGFVENFRPEVVGSWSIYRGGQDVARRRAAELGVEAAEFERSALHNRLAAAVTGAYYAALAAPRRVAVAEQSIKAVNSQLELARNRLAEGAALKADVLSLEVRSAEAREALLQARNAVALSRAALSTLLGGALEAANEPRPTAAGAASASTDDFSKRLAQALLLRPEMQAAQRQVDMRRAELEGERGGHLPRVNAFASYGQNTRSIDFNANQDNFTVGVSAEVDLFAGGAVNARIAQAERRVSEAEALLERTRLEIEEELRRADARYQETRAREQVTQAGATAAEEALRLVQEQSLEGAATVTRYLEAESDRAGTALRAILAEYEMRVAQAELRKALGEWR